jgi:hypothetical protein
VESTVDEHPLEIDLYYDSDCPNAGPVRAQLQACLGERELTWRLREHRDAGRLSPTLLVNGDDVLPAQAAGTGCRLDVPSRDDICRALDAASEQDA